jgi:hypothetical protein
VMPDPGSSKCRWQTRRPQASNASSSTSEPWWSRGGGRVSQRSVAAIQLRCTSTNSRFPAVAQSGCRRGWPEYVSGRHSYEVRRRDRGAPRFVRPGSCQIRRLALLMVESGRFRVGSVATADDLVHESPHPTQPRADSAAPTDISVSRAMIWQERDRTAGSATEGRLSHGTRAHHGTTAAPPRVRPR